MYAFDSDVWIKLRKDNLLKLKVTWSDFSAIMAKRQKCSGVEVENLKCILMYSTWVNVLSYVPPLGIILKTQKQMYVR